MEGGAPALAMQGGKALHGWGGARGGRKRKLLSPQASTMSPRAGVPLACALGLPLEYPWSILDISWAPGHFLTRRSRIPISKKESLSHQDLPTFIDLELGLNQISVTLVPGASTWINYHCLLIVIVCYDHLLVCYNHLLGFLILRYHC